jgi:hypothetical protein
MCVCVYTHANLATTVHEPNGLKKLQKLPTHVAHHFEGVSREIVSPTPVARLVRRESAPFVVGGEESDVVAAGLACENVLISQRPSLVSL